MVIDLNCDLGEGAGFDDELLPLITSANVCCNAHAGSPEDIARTLELAAKFGVAVGAHPGHPDRDHFGRRELVLSLSEVIEQVRAQIHWLNELGERFGVTPRYLKPHGGLYHQANRDDEYADAIVAAATLWKLPVVGLPGSRLQLRAEGNVPFIPEGFADRRYMPDGTLMPRDHPGALLDDPVEAVRQVKELIALRNVRTICVHGDHPQAIAFVRAVRDELMRAGFTIRPFA